MKTALVLTLLALSISGAEAVADEAKAGDSAYEGPYFRVTKAKVPKIRPRRFWITFYRDHGGTTDADGFVLRKPEKGDDIDFYMLRYFADQVVAAGTSREEVEHSRDLILHSTMFQEDFYHAVISCLRDGEPKCSEFKANHVLDTYANMVESDAKKSENFKATGPSLGASVYHKPKTPEDRYDYLRIVPKKGSFLKRLGLDEIECRRKYMYTRTNCVAKTNPGPIGPNERSDASSWNGLPMADYLGTAMEEREEYLEREKLKAQPPACSCTSSSCPMPPLPPDTEPSEPAPDQQPSEQQP